MNKLKLVSFQAGHIYDMAMRAQDYKFYSSLNEYLGPVIAAMESGAAFTAIEEEGQIIGCAGLQPLWKGVMEAWIIVSPLIVKHKLWLFKTLRLVLDNMQIGHKINRIQASPVDGSPTEKLVTMLGFKWEGHMPCYGPNGEDHVRYGRIRCQQPSQQ